MVKRFEARPAGIDGVEHNVRKVPRVVYRENNDVLAPFRSEESRQLQWRVGTAPAPGLAFPGQWVVQTTRSIRRGLPGPPGAGGQLLASTHRVIERNEKCGGDGVRTTFGRQRPPLILLRY